MASTVAAVGGGGGKLGVGSRCLSTISAASTTASTAASTVEESTDKGSISICHSIWDRVINDETVSELTQIAVVFDCQLCTWEVDTVVANTDEGQCCEGGGSGAIVTKTGEYVTKTGGFTVFEEGMGSYGLDKAVKAPQGQSISMILPKSEWRQVLGQCKNRGPWEQVADDQSQTILFSRFCKQMAPFVSDRHKDRCFSYKMEALDGFLLRDYVLKFDDTTAWIPPLQTMVSNLQFVGDVPSDRIPNKTRQVIYRLGEPSFEERLNAEGVTKGDILRLILSTSHKKVALPAVLVNRILGEVTEAETTDLMFPNPMVELQNSPEMVSAKVAGHGDLTSANVFVCPKESAVRPFDFRAPNEKGARVVVCRDVDKLCWPGSYVIDGKVSINSEGELVENKDGMLKKSIDFACQLRDVLQGDDNEIRCQFIRDIRVALDLLEAAPVGSEAAIAALNRVRTNWVLYMVLSKVFSVGALHKKDSKSAHCIVL